MYIFVVAGHRSDRTRVVRGQCRQTALPRMFYTGDDFPYKVDLVFMPSNCDCVVDLSSDDVDDAGGENRMPPEGSHLVNPE